MRLLGMRMPFWHAKFAEPKIKVSLSAFNGMVRWRADHFAITDTSSKSITTKSKPTAFPSALRSKRSAVQTLTAEDLQTDAVIQQTCPECGREEMRFYTLQLRSADEGTTVFYTCECGYK